MHLDLKLRDLPRLSLSEAMLKRPLADLISIKTRNEERWGAGTNSPAFNNRKEKLRRRLQGAMNPSRELKKIFATEVGCQRLMLSLYVESHGQPWLPPFDEGVAADILGNDGERWNASRRRQATLLFFERFDSLPALAFLTKQLCSAYAASSSAVSGSAAVWSRERERIFQIEGPLKIAASAKKGESLQELMDRHGIPAKGAFPEKLRQVYLLETLQRCSFGAEPAVLQEIEHERDKPAVDSLLLGAAALRILVSRVQEEGRRHWPESWRKWLVRLGCDPRMGIHTAEGAKWWGWATPSQWNLAVQGIIGLSLNLFLDFLDGTVLAHQWEERREFLQSLLNSEKIVDARLVLHERYLQRLPEKMRDPLNTALLTHTKWGMCIIALKCIDEVYLLEGTSDFSLRSFHGTFPIKGFWERQQQQYRDSDLRIWVRSCFHTPHKGRWCESFLFGLRYNWNIEWKL
jgi:hypothetical protein